jgi:Flp pilus assembly CpaF family ATPase
VTTRTDAYDIIRRDAITGIERRRIQPAAQIGEVQVEIERAVDDYQRRARLGDEVPLGDPPEMARRVLRSIAELGPLSELLARRDVEEVFVEGARVTYLDADGRLHGLTEPTTEGENRQIVDRLLAATERQLNAKHPLVQARVLDGTARLTAAIEPVADRLSATVRRYTVRDVTLDALVARDALTVQAADFLWAVMQLRSRIAVSGEPGAGKTTLAAALLSAVPTSHCIRSCEEIRELAVPVLHGGYYEVRPEGLDGTGEISLRDLVKFVLAGSIVASREWRRTRRFHNTLRCTCASRRTVTARVWRLSGNGNCWRRRLQTSAGVSGPSTWTETSRRTRASNVRGGNSCWSILVSALSTGSSLSIRIGCSVESQTLFV